MIRTSFDIPGKPVTAEELKPWIDKEILVATKTQLYASGPFVSIRVGYVNDNGRIVVSGDPHAQPYDKFQCWWPLPQVTFEELKPEKRR